VAGEASIDRAGAEEVSGGYSLMLGALSSIECVAGSPRDSKSSALKPSRPVCDFGHVALASTLRLFLSKLLPLLLVLATGLAIARTEPTLEELKARISSASVADKAKICLEIAEKQLSETDKEYTADNIEKAQTSLTDVVSYSELARDYSIQSHKHQKQTEIAIRSMTRKLNDLLHVVGREEQGPLKDAISHLERVRDDLLVAMFPKGTK
jgi:hypothetical protein